MLGVATAFLLGLIVYYKFSFFTARLRADVPRTLFAVTADTMPPLGYYTRAGTGIERDIIIDEERRPYLVKMFEMSASGMGGRRIMQWLEDNKVTTRTGKKIHLSTIYKILNNTFYYGEFEYPNGSGNWYQGNHPPMIDKKLFMKVKRQQKVPQKSKWGAKEFPFRRFLTCGSCGSGIVGEEKIKDLKDGSRRRHVNYRCSKKKNYDCKERYAKEVDIVKGLLGMKDNLLVPMKELEPGLRRDLEKQVGIMKLTDESITNEKAVPLYIEYVLRKGSNFEKTRLVRNLGMPLLLHDRTIQRASL